MLGAGTIAKVGRGFDSSRKIDEPERRVAPAGGRRREVQERMKKTLLLFLLLPFMAVASHAQESRQDISVSVTGIFTPFITGNDVQQSATDGLGGLGGYRYMLTPRSGLEVNYQYAQNAQKYYTSFNNVRVHDRMQEFSGAYVLNANFKNWNPFIEGGPAAFIFSPPDAPTPPKFDGEHN